MEDLREFYKDKKVFITGNTGFKGAWLSIWLKELGAKVTGYSLEPPYDKSIFELANLEKEINHIEGDTRDISRLEKSIVDAQPDLLFHLAAQPIVRTSYDIPQETIEINIMGAVNVLEAVRKTQSIENICMVISDKTYHNKEWEYNYRENDELGGLDPYSVSKSCVDLIVNSYRESFLRLTDTSINSVRAGNVIGGGDWSKDRIIPDAARALLTEESIQVRNPHATRPWQHVLDCLHGYLLVTAKTSQDRSLEGAWNFGPENESIIPVGKLMDKFVESWGQGEWLNVQSNKAVKLESNLLGLDCNKAHNLLKWKPRLNIEETVKSTTEWYKEYQNQKIYELCKRQIDEFMLK